MTSSNTLSPSRQTPHWRTLRRAALLPNNLRPWLTHRGSLTRLLRRASGNQLSVRVLHQGWGRPRADEARLLHLRSRQWVLIREVELSGQGEPWILARTLIPMRTLRGANRQLLHLGTRPLGDLLFQVPTLRRAPLQFARLRALDGQTLWARRSLFQLHHAPLLVSEVFLPAVERLQFPG